MAMLYEYLTGPEFRNRVGGMIEAFTEMQEDLIKERRAVQAQLRKRERQLERALANITAFYGDLRGIGGKQLADLPQMTFTTPTLDAASIQDTQVEEEWGATRLSRTDTAGLSALLLKLLPEDGSALGNVTLRLQLSDSAMDKLGRDVSDEEYELCKSALLASGVVRKGKGRGGSLARIVAGHEGAAEELEG
jgi:hypothetical protein